MLHIIPIAFTGSMIIYYCDFSFSVKNHNNISSISYNNLAINKSVTLTICVIVCYYCSTQIHERFDKNYNKKILKSSFHSFSSNRFIHVIFYMYYILTYNNLFWQELEQEFKKKILKVQTLERKYKHTHTHTLLKWNQNFAYIL